VKQYYMFRNAGTGQYITYSNSTFKVATKTTPAATEKFHVMKGRKDIKVGSGTSATNVCGYWIMNVTNNNPRAMVATASGNVGATGFDLSADAASQHWVILTAEETLKFDEAARLSALNELKTLISNLNKVKSTPHTEDAEGADVAIDAALSYAQTVADDANSGLDLLRATIESTSQAGMDFLASATPASVDEPFDITFLVKNASISDNTGWSVAPTFNFSCLEFYQATFDFNQTITGLPAGTYKTTVQAFQRPGAYATAYSDYVNGTNKVTTFLYANTESVKVAHIGTEARTSKLGGTEAAVGSPVRYIPDNMEAASKYFAKGLYENEIMTELAEGKKSLKIGLRCSSSSDGYWTIFDNFHLYYYGDMTKEHITGIDEVATGADNVPAAVYNLQGQKVGDSLEGLPRGIYIVNKKKVLVR
jgi:hypothetical protein